MAFRKQNIVRAIVNIVGTKMLSEPHNRLAVVRKEKT